MPPSRIRRSGWGKLHRRNWGFLDRLRQLLAGEDRCEWSLWFKTRHKLPKVPDPPELVRYKREHNDLLRRRVAELEREGLPVTIEDDNRLAEVGQLTGTMFSGKPDIAIVQRDEVRFEECKSGRRRDSDAIQVLLYRYLARDRFNGRPISGNVVYVDAVEPVDMTRLPEIRGQMRGLLARVNDETAALVPSIGECRFCKVALYCSARAAEPDQAWANDL